MGSYLIPRYLICIHVSTESRMQKLYWECVFFTKFHRKKASGENSEIRQFCLFLTFIYICMYLQEKNLFLSKHFERILCILALMVFRYPTVNLRTWRFISKYLFRSRFLIFWLKYCTFEIENRTIYLSTKNRQKGWRPERSFLSAVWLLSNHINHVYQHYLIDNAIRGKGTYEYYEVVSAWES